MRIHVLGDGALRLSLSMHDDRLPGGMLLFMPTGGNPLVWGSVNGGIIDFESKEELDDILRAASYAFGIPQAETDNMRELIKKQEFTEHRTETEAAWRSALYLGARTIEHDLALIKVARHVDEMRRTGNGQECSVDPICLDPSAESEGVQRYGMFEAMVHAFQA